MYFESSKQNMVMTDDEILAQCRSEETKEKGFRNLMNAYQQRLYYHIRRFVNTHEDADDVLQNVFIKIWKNIDSFRAESSLYTWVYRIANNESITYINKQKRTATFTLEHTAAIYKTGSDNENPEQVQLRLQAAINTLPDKQKQVFIMRYYDEMPYEEMSKVLETSVGALKASYHHAVKKIEEIITA